MIPDAPYRVEPGVVPGPYLPGVVVPDLSASSEVVIRMIRYRSGTTSVLFR